MTSQGDEILRDEIDTAITANARPSNGEVCSSHDSLRLGVLVLLKCKRAEMRSPGWQVGGIGVGALGIVYAILKAHGMVP